MKKHLRFVAAAAALLISGCVEPRDHLPDAGGDAHGTGGTGGTGLGGAGGTAGTTGTGGTDGGGLLDATMDSSTDQPTDVASDTGAAADHPAIVDVADTSMNTPDLPPLKDNGAACGGGSECKNGNCVEGVCCDGACGTKCNSCLNANTGKPSGQCAPVKAGLAHAADCTAGAASSCGLDGKCDGAGACRSYPSGTACAPEACTDGAQTSSYASARTCNGQGACSPAATTSNCGSAYRCTGTKCRTTCTGAQDCVPADYCAGTACMSKKADGQLCASGAECVKGVCGGRCCTLGCTCTQPDPANLIANAGFDQNINGWTATGGTLAWAGSDAQNCPFSGCMRITLPANAPEQTMSFCVHNTPLTGTFNFGIRVRASVAAMTLCQANFYADLNCLGDLVGQNETDSASAAQGWTLLDATVSPNAANSVGMTCYLFSDPLNQSSIDFDMAYISPAPKKF